MDSKLRLMNHYPELDIFIGSLILNHLTKFYLEFSQDTTTVASSSLDQ